MILNFNWETKQGPVRWVDWWSSIVWWGLVFEQGINKELCLNNRRSGRGEQRIWAAPSLHTIMTEQTRTRFPRHDLSSCDRFHWLWCNGETKSLIWSLDDSSIPLCEPKSSSLVTNYHKLVSPYWSCFHKNLVTTKAVTERLQLSSSPLKADM